MVAGESGEFWVIGGNAHRDSQPDACPLYKLKLASHKGKFACLSLFLQLIEIARLRKHCCYPITDLGRGNIVPFIDEPVQHSCPTRTIPLISPVLVIQLRTGGADHPSPRFAASFHQVGEKLVLLYGRSSGQGLLKRLRNRRYVSGSSF